MISSVASSMPASRPLAKYDFAVYQVEASRRISSTTMTARIPIAGPHQKRNRGPGFALGHRDLDLGHHRGDLAAQLDGIGAAFQGSQVEPLMRGDEIDYAGTSAGPIQAALEQHVGYRTCFHRRRRIQINVPLKHLTSPF